jgi:hypothetical protein
MFNQVSLAELILRIRQRADMVDTQFVTDEELTSYCNESLGELYDLIIGSAAQEYFMRSCNIYELPPWRRGLASDQGAWYRDGYMCRDGKVPNLDPLSPDFEVGDGTYAVLPPDFYKILGVDANVGQDNIPWKLTPYNFNKRDNMAPFNGTWQKGLTMQYRLAGRMAKMYDRPQDGNALFPPLPPFVGTQTPNAPGVAPSAPIVEQSLVSLWSPQILYLTPFPPTLPNEGRGLITVWYIPLPPKFLTTDGDAAEVVTPESQIVPGFAHWDEYLTVDVAMRIRDKEESETQLLLVQKQNITQRILAQAPTRDAQFPETVQDTSYAGIQVNTYPWYWQNWFPGGM